MFYGDLSAIPEADLQHIDDLVMDNLVSVLMGPATSSSSTTTR